MVHPSREDFVSPVCRVCGVLVFSFVCLVFVVFGSFAWLFLFGFLLFVFLASLCFLHALALSLTGAQRTDSSSASKKNSVFRELLFWHFRPAELVLGAKGCLQKGQGPDLAPNPVIFGSP